MTTPGEQWLCRALDRFKEIVMKGLCSKVDITYFSNLLKYEFGRREVSIDEKEWLTKIETSKLLGVSTSTLDRMILRKEFPRGRKIVHQKYLVWKREIVEQYKETMLLKRKTWYTMTYDMGWAMLCCPTFFIVPLQCNRLYSVLYFFDS